MNLMSAGAVNAVATGVTPAAAPVARVAPPSVAPLRVLTFTSIFPNPAERFHGLFVHARVRALSRLASVQVMAPVPWSPPLPGLPARYYRCQDVPARESRNGLVIHHPRFVAIPRVLKSTDPVLMATLCAPSVLALHRRWPFAVIDAHWACPDGVAAAMLAALVGVPFTITVRGDDINIFAHESNRRRAIRWALRKASRVIALSNDLRHQVIALGVPPDRVAVIANGVDVERFQPIARGEARRRLRIGPDERLLLSVGRLHTSKGFPLLVEAMARLGERFRDTRLVIIGEPDPEADATPAILDAVDRCSMQGRVDIVGRRTPDELVSWYSAADLFCLATMREGSANVLFEAMACGLPSVTTDVGGNRETIADARFGLLITPDAPSIARAMETALERRWDRDELIRRARRRGWDVVALEVCEQLRLATRARETCP